MKNRLFQIETVLAALAFVFTSCNPSEDDVKGKIIKPWKVNKYYVNNEDGTAAFNEQFKNFSFQFFDDMSFVQTAFVNDTFQARSGFWYLNENLDSLFLESQSDTNRFFIRLLRMRNLNIREVKNSDSYDYLLVDF